MIFDRVNEKYYREITNKEAQDITRKRIHWICSQAEGKKILDIGCSQGIVCILLAREGFYCTGVDIMQQSIDYANKELTREEEIIRNRVRFIKQDALNLDFEDNTFDTVMLTEVIEHLSHPEKALIEARRVLKPNGKFVLTTPFGYNKSIDHKNYYYFSNVFLLLKDFFIPEEFFKMETYICFTSHKTEKQLSNDKEMQLLEKYIKQTEQFLIEQEMRLFNLNDHFHAKIDEAQHAVNKLQDDLKAQRVIIDKYEQEKKDLLNIISGSEKSPTETKEEKDHSREDKDDDFPFITFGIFTYNRAHLIKEAIQSIFDQNIDNFEILVVDDGSKDNTEEVVRSIDSDKIRYIRKEHSGAPGTRNRLIEEAKGDRICWIGDDDKLEPGVIQEYYEILKDKDPDVIYGDIQQYDDKSNEDLHLYEAPNYTESNKDFLKNIISGVGLTDGGSLIKRSVYERFGNYDNEFQRTQDLEFWARIGPYADFHKHERIVYKCRKHRGHLSSGDMHDRSYESLINKKILNEHSLKDIYWDLDWDEPVKARAEALKEVARGFMITGDYYNACRTFEKAGLDPFDPVRIRWWFNCLLAKGDYDKLKELIKELESRDLQLYKEFSEVYERFKQDIDILEKSYDDQDNFDQKELSDIINKYSFSRKILFFLGKNFEILHNNDEAYRYFMLALQCDASNEDTYRKAIHTASNEDKKKKAKEKRERLLRELPFYDETLDTEDATVKTHEIDEKEISKPAKVSIVICAHNNLAYTKDCIENIYKKTPEEIFEIIAIDNGSSDNTKQFFESLTEVKENFKPVYNEENLGFAKGCNQGINVSEHEYVLLLNNDTVPQHGWLQNMLSEINSHHDTAIAGACLLYPVDDLIQHVWVTIGNQNNVLAPYHAYCCHNLKDVPEAQISREVSAVTGACMLIRKSVFEEVGLLDEKYENSFEDIDFCFRVTQAGYKIRYAAESKLIHYESLTKSRHDKDVQNWQRMNQLWLGKVRFDESQEETLRNNAIIDEKREKAAILLKEFYDKEKEKIKEKAAESEGDIDFSIIIPVHNNIGYTKQCLQGIAKTRGLFGIEIIIIDNASTDGTADYVRSLGRNVHLIQNTKNETYAHSNNQGAAIAKGKFLIFLNNDTFPFAGWLESFANEFDDHEKTAIQGAKLIYENGTIQHAGLVFGSRPGRSSEPYHAYLTADPSMPFVNHRRKVQFVTGACLAIRKEIFEKINGFDEGYIFGWEDTDLCMKVNNEGYDVVYNPGAVLYHYESITKKIRKDAGEDVLSQDTPKEVKNRERFFRKWKNLVKKDDVDFYAEDGFKLEGHSLIPVRKISEQEEIQLEPNEKKKRKTSIEPKH